MKDSYDIVKEQMKNATQDMMSYFHLFEHQPNGKITSVICTECNGGLFFFSHVTNDGCTEITTSQFLNLIELDQEKFQKQGWL